MSQCSKVMSFVNETLKFFAWIRLCVHFMREVRPPNTFSYRPLYKIYMIPKRHVGFKERLWNLPIHNLSFYFKLNISLIN